MGVVYKRIQSVMLKEDLKPAAFARQLGEKLQRIQDIQSGKQRAPEDVLIKIVEIFNVNGTWLLTGKGSMFLNEKPEINESPKWFTNWWQHADEEHKHWLKIQLKNTK